MSGIAGIYHTDGRPVEANHFQRMLASIAYRGLDGAGAWITGPVGLGHRMLWTTPESLHEHQPLSSEDGSLWLTADSRVDNRDELRVALLANGARLRTDTDAELILWSYETWGEGCPAKIIGDFAFVIWDARLRRLFCARDPIGIKPFFYHFDGTTFRWASAPQALFCGGTVPQQPNLRLISLFLLNRFEDREETLYKDILRLPPAHSLVVERDRIRKARYWELNPSHTVRHRTDAEYAAHFLELFRTSVTARLRSHGPVGVLLSGGLDSSSVVCVAQELDRASKGSRVPLEAFSIVFGDMPCDERSFIEDVVRQSDVRASQFRHQENSSWLDFERTENYFDCWYSPTLLMLGPAFQQARQHNLRAMLTGIGGDDLAASSVVHLTDLARQRRFTDLFRQLRYDADLSSCSRWSLFRDYCLKPMVPQPVRTVVKPLAKSMRGNRIPKWLTSECLRNANASAPMNEANSARFSTSAQQRMHEKLEYGSNTNVALGRLENFTSRFVFECRHPFFDRRLIEFMIAVPEEQRWFGPSRKTILRQAMVGILPESIRHRNNKADFTNLVDREFTQRQADKAEKLLRASVLGELGLIEVFELQRLFRQYRQGPVSHAVRNACQNVIGLELWCRSAMQPAHN